MSLCVCVCVCVCVSNTTNLRKNYMLKCLFLWLETGSFSETGKRLIVLVYECLRGPFMVLLFSPVDSCWRECVAALEKFGQKENKGVWRRRIYRKYASCRWLKNAWLEFTRGPSFKHVTWSSWPMVSRDWILSVRHLCGTSGIAPKIIFRSVKSYRIKTQSKYEKYSFLAY